MVWTSPQHGSREENEENGTRTLENMRRVEIDGRRDGSRCRAHQVLPPILLSTTGFCGVRVWALGGLDMRVRGKEVGGRERQRRGEGDASEWGTSEDKKARGPNADSDKQRPSGAGTGLQCLDRPRSH